MIVQSAEPAASTAGATAAKFQFAGAGGAVLSGLLSNEMGVLVGIVVALVGGVVSWIYKHREDRRRQQIHAVRIEMLRKGEAPPLDPGSTLT